jgi:hypothetical protein
VKFGSKGEFADDRRFGPTRVGSDRLASRCPMAARGRYGSPAISIEECLKQPTWRHVPAWSPPSIPKEAVEAEFAKAPLRKLKANPPARDPECVQADTWPRPWGYKVRLCIEAEKELQVLSEGWWSRSVLTSPLKALTSC